MFPRNPELLDLRLKNTLWNVAELTLPNCGVLKAEGTAELVLFMDKHTVYYV
jgi:hypothetical protein